MTSGRTSKVVPIPETATAEKNNMCRTSLPDFVPTVVHGRNGRKEVFFVERHRYSQLEVVGSGSYGVVCKAVDNTNNRPVAIKKVKNVMKDEGDARRVLRELRVLRHLGGKANTLKIVDAYSYPPHTPLFEDVYIVTQLFETDFDKVLRSTQDLSEDHTAYFLYQLLRSTANMHANHILHRDLKPANLLVNANCDLVVCDMGLSRGVKNLVQPGKGSDDTQEEREHLTEYVVTRWYRPPEILAESPFYGASADVWSVGCIFGEMLSHTRRPIFKGTSPQNQMGLIVKALGIPSTSELDFCTSRESRGAIGRLCNTIRRENIKPWKFHERFPTANPLAVDLLEKMLKFDPRERITAEEAMRHPFLADVHSHWSPLPKARHFDFSFETAHNRDAARQPRIPKSDLQQLFLYEVNKYRCVSCPIDVPLYHKHRVSGHSRKTKKKPAPAKGEDDTTLGLDRMLLAALKPEEPTWICKNCFLANTFEPAQSACGACGTSMPNKNESPGRQNSNGLPDICGEQKNHLCNSKRSTGGTRSRLMSQIAHAESRDSSLPKISRSKSDSHDEAIIDPAHIPQFDLRPSSTKPRMSNQVKGAQPNGNAPRQRRVQSAPRIRHGMPRTLPRDPPFDVPVPYVATSRAPVDMGQFQPVSAR
jgi:mitogen-activated protein kinase 1/3